MAAVTKVREVLGRVSVLLQDVLPQYNRWPEAELVDWLNDGQLAIAKFLPAANSRVDAIKLKPGTRQSIETILAADIINGDGSTAVNVSGVQLIDVIRNMGANGSTPGTAIPHPVDRRILDTQRSNWHTVTGTSINQITYDPQTPKHFYVQPAVPVSPAVWIEIAYVAQPTRIPAGGAPGAEIYKRDGASTTVISVSDEYVDDLVNYTAARAYLKDYAGIGNDAKANQFSSLFVSSLNAKVAAITGTNPNLKALPLAPQPLASAS